MPVAAFTLTRYPWRAVPGGLRRPIRGERFSRRLGTGRGFTLGKGGDLRRWATFSVWDDEAALDRFLAPPPRAEEHWSVKLQPLSWHGTWAGVDVLAGAAEGDGGDGPVVVLTRATIPWRKWPAFYRSVPPVESWLHAQDGLLAAVGIGERPLGRQATFSVWRSAAALEAFAYRGPPHADVVRRSRDDGWFAEELFARFRPYASTGTWSGKDPLCPD
jgi:hypothetical protein